MNQRRKQLFTGLRDLKTFFNNKGFLEVTTPPMVQNPGMEVHIHPFKVSKAIDNIDTEWFLQTSPEFAMKELLSEGFEKIYNLSYSFRDEPESSTHRPQFLMLEWYRAHQNYNKIKTDCSELITEFPSSKFKKVEEVTVEDLFLEYCGFNILDFLDKQDLYEKIKRDFPKFGIDKDLPWEDLFFILFLNLIEPEFKNHTALIIDKYPAPLSALSTICKKDERVCERFELYLNGIEVANCFNELTDLETQKRRFQKDSLQKKKTYGYQLPDPEVLYQALEKGLPPAAGIAMGVERFLMAINHKDNLFY
jgi:lysyl-tRNA synthetase class 2